MKSVRPQQSIRPAGDLNAFPELKQRLERFSVSIRSPMQTALGTAELLKDTKLDSAQLALVNTFILATEAAFGELQALFENPSDAYIPQIDSGSRDKQPLDPGAITILVVDDNRVNLQLTKETLVREGFKVRTAVDGRDAVDVFKTRPVSLVLMDLEMPIMDGLMACSAMRQEEMTNQPSSIRIPILALTADNAEGMVDKVLNHGFDGYLAKPMSRAKLLDSVHQMLLK